MPLSKQMARFNLRYANRVMRHIAGWMPTLALMEHVGRTSGRVYETPVNVFRADDRYVFALTYGESAWVKNVLAAGGCDIRTRGHNVALADPERLHDPSRHLIPVPYRWVLAVIHVDDFVLMRPT